MLNLVSGCTSERIRIGRMQAIDEAVQGTAKAPPLKRGYLVKRGGGPRKAWVERLVIVGDGQIAYFNKDQSSTKVLYRHLVEESRYLTDKRCHLRI